MSLRDFWDETLATARSLDRLSYYQILNVRQDVSSEEIREAFYKRATQLHPDRHVREPNEERKKAALSVYVRLNEAHRVLSDPALRAEYDKKLELGIVRMTEAAPATRATSDDPRSPQARKFYELGRERERAGDRPNARLQYRLAQQLEPGSAAILQALQRVEAAGAPESPPRTQTVPPAPSSDFARETTRHPFAKPVKVRCSTWDQFVTLHAKNISRGGLFVKTVAPPELGALVNIDVTLPDARTVSLEAEVVRIVAPERGHAGETPGMGLRFLEMDTEVQKLVDELIAFARGQRGAAPAAGPVPEPSVSASARPPAEPRAPSTPHADPGAPSTPHADPGAPSTPHADPGAPSNSMTGSSTSSGPVADSVIQDLLVELGRLREVRPHEALGVPPDADRTAIRKAYLRLTHRYHPDLFVRFHSPDVIEVVSEAFAIVRRAYEALRDRRPQPQVAPGAPAEQRAPDAPAAPTPPTPPTPRTAPPAPPAPPPAPKPARPLLEEDLFDEATLGGTPKPAGFEPLASAPMLQQARAEIRAGRYAEAKATLTRALTLDPRDRYLRAAYHLACAYDAKSAGRVDEARTQFETVLLFDKQCEEAIEELRQPVGHKVKIGKGRPSGPGDTGPGSGTKDRR